MRQLNVLIFQQRGWGMKIGHFLARQLQNEGCKLAALTLKRSTHQFVIRQTEVVYDLVLNNDEIMSRPREYLGEDRFSLEEICYNLGIASIWPIVTTLRNHVRSYGYKFYYAFRQSVTDEEIVNYVIAFYKAILYIFDRFHPDVVVAPNYVSLPHIMLNLYAAKHSVPMIGVIDSKVKGVSLFVNSYKADKGAFFGRVTALNNGEVESLNLARAKEYIAEFRNSPDPGQLHVSSTDKEIGGRLLARLRNRILSREDFLKACCLILKWYVSGHANCLESTGITLDCRPPKIILRDYFCRRRYTRYSQNLSYYPIDRLRRYVYFPLQFQPEEQIDVLSPYFSNQIETARQVAMSLPDSYTLAVKDHPAMIGLRPPSYLEKIMRTPNVKLVDYRIPSGEVIRRADLVISPSSTTLAEAAFLRKPAIQLGDLGTTLQLPNVVKHTNMTTLSNRIKEALLIDTTTREYDRQLENYVAAVYDTGLEFDYYGVWEKGIERNMEPLWEFYKKEIERVTTGELPIKV